MRKPNEEEIKEVMDFLGYQKEDDMEDILNYGVVFDDYMTDGPGYAGKVMLVVYPAYPNMFDCFMWEQGKLKQMKQER